MRTGWLVLLLGWTQWAGAQVTPPKVQGALLVVDKPYTGVREYDREQKTGDGHTVKGHEETKFWRDSAGRTRTEVTRDRSEVVTSMLTDPVAKLQYRWNNKQKVAFVTKLGEPIPAHDPPHPLTEGEVRDTTSTVQGNKLKARASLLPAKTIVGQTTTGSHLVAYSDPERQTVVMTNDMWTQPEYHVVLEQSITDTQYGHRMWHFKSFKAEEPKADLFQVPKGYEVKQAETPDTEQFE